MTVNMLPQQRLVLELLSVSGDIAIPRAPDDSILWRTIKECEGEGWLSVGSINPRIFKISITGGGRLLINQT